MYEFDPASGGYVNPHIVASRLSEIPVFTVPSIGGEMKIDLQLAKETGLCLLQVGAYLPGLFTTPRPPMHKKMTVAPQKTADTPSALRLASIGVGKGKKRVKAAKDVVDTMPAVFSKRITRSSAANDPRIGRVIKMQAKARKHWLI